MKRLLFCAALGLLALMPLASGVGQEKDQPGKPKYLGDATVVVMYMFPEFMNLWQPIAKEKLKPGTRILSHDYAWNIGNWEPDETVVVKSATREHKVHMWTVKGK